VRTVLYVLWALFVCGATAACIQVVRKTRAQERLIASWPKVRATVTGSRQGWTKLGNRNVRFWPAYQFLDPRGVLFAGESEVSYVERPAPGSSVEVAYNPANPNESFQVDAPSRVVLGCLIPALAMIALMAFWFIGVFPLD
jgi:hypothetical protein